MNKNTMPELFDEQPDGMEQPTQEQILMSESELLRGLIEAGNEKDSEASYERIQIKRGGKLKFEFRIRPISEEESLACHDHATKFAPRLIYTATVDEDRAKLWDNKQAQQAFNVLQGVDVIDCVLLSGEKDRIIDRINEISGYDDEADETAKN